MDRIPTELPFRIVLERWEKANPSPWTIEKERNVCEHIRTQRCFRVDSIGREFFGLQCCICGRWVRAIKKASIPEQSPLPPFDEILRERSYAQERERYTQLREQNEEYAARRAGLWRGYYESYMLSPRWFNSRARRAALTRNGGMCAACGTRRSSHVHHRSYQRLGEELPEDLVALCAGCHRAQHEHMWAHGAPEEVPA